MHTHSVCRGCLIPRRNDIDRLRVRVLICFFFRFFHFLAFLVRHLLLSYSCVFVMRVFLLCCLGEKKKVSQGIQYRMQQVMISQLFSRGRVQRHDSRCTMHATDCHLPSRAYLAWQISIFVPRM